MTRGRLGAALLILLSSLLLAACPTVDLSRYGPSGEDVDGSAAGAVAGFGSVRVAGTEFSDNASTTVADDRGRGIDDIVAGMAVTVRGSIGPDFALGTAASVAIEREVRGPVDDNGVALDNNTIRVLGQTVLVTPTTVIVDIGGGEIGLEGLKELQDDGRRSGLEVHGGVEDNGTIHAVYVGRVQDNVVVDDDAQLRGTISEFDAATRIFRIGAQRVSYAGIPSDGRVDWPGAGLADGLGVDVRGYLDAVGGSGTLRTDRAGDRLQVIDVDLGGSSDRVVLEGYVLSGDSSSFAMTVPGGTAPWKASSPPPATRSASEEGEGRGDAERVGRRVRAGALRRRVEGVRRPSRGRPGRSLRRRRQHDHPPRKTVETDRYTRSSGTRRGAPGRASGCRASVRRHRAGDRLARRLHSLRDRRGREDRPHRRDARQGRPPGARFVLGPPFVDVDPRPDREHLLFPHRLLRPGRGSVRGRDAFYSRLEELGAGTLVRVRGGEFVSAHSRIDAPRAETGWRSRS
jgi:hypothetical protein